MEWYLICSKFIRLCNDLVSLVSVPILWSPAAIIIIIIGRRAYHDDDGARAKQIKRIYKKKTKKNTTHV